MNNENSIYRDIEARTGGDVYIGVVGPVRTGKSTFIKRVMETLVLPGIKDEYERERANDTVPQSAGGKTVMTTEPKFVPEEAVKISVDDMSTLDVKLIDCVGYVVPGALGQKENGEPRMVTTPWSDKEMPFEMAAEIGTRKVITDHSTIGILVTSDGSVCDIAREEYDQAEKRVVEELKAIKKPFAIVLNSAHPESDEAERIALELEEKYGVPVALVNCLLIDAEDIKRILELVLYEFPVREISVDLPEWVRALPSSHRINRELDLLIREIAENTSKMGDIKTVDQRITTELPISKIFAVEMDLGRGCARLALELSKELYFDTVSELCDINIKSESELIKTVSELSEVKKRYDKISLALKDAEEIGYGIVVPDITDMKLEEPKIVRHSGGYGVRLRASAPSIHMIKATIETEIDPVVGSEQQSEELLKFLLSEFEEEPTKIWDTNLFGKTLHELVNEGLHTKLENMPPDARAKLSETLGRIINEGSGGLICIIL